MACVVAVAAITLRGFVDQDARPGSSSRVIGQGIGDPYYPDDGNLGYDVRGYDVRLDYTPASQRISATTTITATATERLTNFHLDLLGLHVRRAVVNGSAATVTRSGAHELVVSPRRAVPAGAVFVAAISYDGTPGVDPVGTIRSGWYASPRAGGGFVAGEPHSCSVWYPCNDHPTDKATFRLTATVPRPLSVVSVGRQLPTTQAVRSDGIRVRTFRWVLDEPTATYLTTWYVDRLTFERSALPDGTPLITAYGPRPGGAPLREARLPKILRVLSRAWGPYPAPAAGGIFVNGNVPFSLETFTRPIYTEGANLTTIVHENGHQWWGDNVSIRRWRDICLNECMASYSQWLWAEHAGADLDERYRRALSGDPGFLNYPLYDMGPGHEFDFQGVYLKGAYFIHALRRKLGDTAFFRAMQGIQLDHGGGNLSMIGLRDELESRTGSDLTSFWDEWVLDTGRPSASNVYPGGL